MIYMKIIMINKILYFGQNNFYDKYNNDVKKLHDKLFLVLKIIVQSKQILNVFYNYEQMKY